MAANFWLSSHWQQWTFTKQQLQARKALNSKFYNHAEYDKFMIFWATFIQEMAKDLSGVYGLRMRTIATAIVYFKRFYLVRRFEDVHPIAMVWTTLVLAARNEENGISGLVGLGRRISLTLKNEYNVNYTLSEVVPPELEDILAETMDYSLLIHQPYRPLEIFLEDLRNFNNGLHTNMVADAKPSLVAPTDSFGYSQKVVKQFSRTNESSRNMGGTGIYNDEHFLSVQDEALSNQLNNQEVEELHRDARRVINDSFKSDAAFLYPAHIIALGKGIEFLNACFSSADNGSFNKNEGRATQKLAV